MTKAELDVDELLPELHLIEDAELRDKVRAIWQELWSESKFEALEDIPISPKVPAPHLPHNRCVVTMALAMADALERFHGIKLDRDMLVAAGLLQDVSKLVEMQPGRARAHRDRAQLSTRFLGQPQGARARGSDRGVRGHPQPHPGRAALSQLVGRKGPVVRGSAGRDRRIRRSLGQASVQHPMNRKEGRWPPGLWKS
jgi:hypothetical protein